MGGPESRCGGRDLDHDVARVQRVEHPGVDHHRRGIGGEHLEMNLAQPRVRRGLHQRGEIGAAQRRSPQ